jgi:ParB-like chromosome segregation protein Spo0J
MSATVTIPEGVALWPVDKLIPYANNPRTHSDAQVAQIAASILEFGFINPIIVDQVKGVILASHGRLLAARKLEMTKAPVIPVGHLSEAQKRAYIIADNKLALNAGWDQELLRLELADLKDQDFDIDLVGFSSEELDALLVHEAGSTDFTAEDAVPEPLEEPVSRRGDLWILGNHRLLCGDSAFGATQK